MPISTISPRRPTVHVTPLPSGTSASRVVEPSGVCARTADAAAASAAPRISVRRSRSGCVSFILKSSADESMLGGTRLRLLLDAAVLRRRGARPRLADGDVGDGVPGVVDAD